MKVFTFVFIFAICLAAAAAGADPAMFHPATGPPTGGPTGRDVCWTDEVDLNGLIGSSEQMLAFGLESEIANDFVPSDYAVEGVGWGGGYYNNSTPCSSGINTPGFDLRLYRDAGCIPGALLADCSIGPYEFTETSLGCQAGFYPIYWWETVAITWGVTSGELYWFGAVMKDHAFPPQGGRLAATYVQSCGSLFKSGYFGFPDWTPAIDVFGIEFDASQEFTCGGVGIGCGLLPTGACCIGDACFHYTLAECNAAGGEYHGEIPCDPNPCIPVPTERTTWGKIKSAYQ